MLVIGFVHLFYAKQHIINVIISLEIFYKKTIKVNFGVYTKVADIGFVYS